MLQPYKGYFISGKALIVHPFSPDWYMGDSVDAPGRLGSIVEVTRFELPSLTTSIHAWRNGSGWSLRGWWWMSTSLQEQNHPQRRNDSATHNDP